MLDTDHTWLKGLVPPKQVPPPWMRMKINQRHPLSLGLTFLFFPAGGDRQNWVKGRYPTSSAGTFLKTARRSGVTSDHTAGNVTLTYAAPSDVANAYTIFSYCGATTSCTSPIMDADKNPSVRVFQFRAPTSTPGFIWFNTASTAFSATAPVLSSTQLANGWTQSAKVGPSDLQGSIVVDGVRTTGDTTTGTIQSVSAGPGVKVGGSFLDGGSAFFWNSYIYIAAIWSRVLPDEEELLLHREPFCFLEPAIDGVWFAGPSGATLDIFKRRHLAHLRR